MLAINEDKSAPYDQFKEHTSNMICIMAVRSPQNRHRRLCRVIPHHLYQCGYIVPVCLSNHGVYAEDDPQSKGCAMPGSDWLPTIGSFPKSKNVDAITGTRFMLVSAG